MNIEDAMGMGLCTSLKCFYKTEYQYLEPVDWDIVPKMYGINYNLAEIVHQANVKLELAFAKMEQKYMDLYMEDKIDKIRRSWDICPKPPGGLTTPKEVVIEYGRKYFTIRQLWDLKHFLDERNIKLESDWPLSWFYSYYLPELGRNYYEIGQETYVTKEIYHVEDIDRIVKVAYGAVG